MESREPPGHQCFLRAFVYLDDGVPALDCIVRELSEAGARLQFAKPLNATGFLDLHIPIKGQNYHARVQWHEGNEIGVVFNAANPGEGNELEMDERLGRLEMEIAALKRSIRRLQKVTGQKVEAL